MKFKKAVLSGLPGRVALKICPRFLTLSSRPKLTIAVTGTGGKSVTSAFINDFMKSAGLTTSFNNDGANLREGFALNLINSVSMSNKPKVDCTIIEADELICDTDLVPLKPDYVLVTNITRGDSGRNGHQINVFDHIDHALRLMDEGTTVILNANDPYSAKLGGNVRKIWYGMGDIRSRAYDSLSPDVTLCPRCGNRLTYSYRHYRSIGKFECTNCAFRTPHIDYDAEFVDFNRGTMLISGHEYPLISDAIYNAFNVLSVIALLREMGYREDDIAAFFKGEEVTEYRETSVSSSGIRYYTQAVDPGNTPALSAVLEHVSKDEAFKDVVLLMNRDISGDPSDGNVSRLYETDFEYLASPFINKVIYGGPFSRELRIRLLMAGVHKDRIICLKNEEDIAENVSVFDITKVYLIHDSSRIKEASVLTDRMVALAKEAR